MKSFFIIPGADMPTATNPLHLEYHYIALDNDYFFMAIDEQFKGRPNWIVLPHILQTNPISETGHEAKLACIGAKPNHRTIDVVMLAGKIHPQICA